MGERDGTRDEALEQRLQALSDLERQSDQSPAATPAPVTSAPFAPAAARATTRRGRLMAILGVVALVMVVMAGALAYLRPRTNTAKQPSTPSQLVLDFAAHHLGCAQDAA